MIRAIAVRARQSWSGDCADSVLLDFDDRHRRRIAMTGLRGLEFLLDLPEAVALRGGDALALEDGRLIEVVAAPEPLVELRGKAPSDLVRLAWHIGNRHLSAQVMPNALRIRRDHVIEDMLRNLGARLIEIEAPFDPEGGAYAAPPAAGHAHDHAHHNHAHHNHAHHGHAHAHHASEAARHDAGDHSLCDHDHDHGVGPHPEHGHPQHGHEHGHGHAPGRVVPGAHDGEA